MSQKLILALDQGTSSSKATLFSTEMNQVALSSVEVAQVYPHNGWIEEDPISIFESELQAVKNVMSKANCSSDDILCVGIANQRETIILWNKTTGLPIYNAIIWQCRRTAKYCSELEDRGFGEKINSKTGLVLDSYFSASKIKWILDNVNGARELAEKGELLAGTVDTWLIWKLSGGKTHITDYTNASRTMLFNIHTLTWDSELLDLFNIPANILPTVKNSSDIYCNTDKSVCGFSVPISACIGDQQSALFAQGCFEPGETKITYGSGCFMLMNTGNETYNSKNNLVSTIAIGLNGKVTYALEGSIFAGGSTLEWLQENMGFANTIRECDDLAKTVDSSEGVFFVPAFSGLGAPYWDMYARGTIIGLTKGTNKAHICRAAIEAICYQIKDILSCMSTDTKLPLKALKVDGGVSVSDLMLQFQSDILNAAVFRPANIETTSFGAAFLAGMAVGLWKTQNEILNYWKIDKSFTPLMDIGIRHDLYKQWLKAVGRSQNWLPGYLPYKNMEVLEEER